MAKLVFIGAGSMSFGLPTFRDIFLCEALLGSTISLMDIDEENLNRMYNLAVSLNRRTGFGGTIERHLDRKNALPGADFVINSIAIERCDLWKKDFFVPRKYGIRHVLGENGGPGALFFTLRTLPDIFDICHDMERLCPNAYLLNFSNPESRIVQAVNTYTKIKCVGLCHGIYMSQWDIAEICGIPYEDIELFAAGMNHFQWVLKARNIRTGEDLYPLLREKEKIYDPAKLPLTRRVFKAYGHWITCSDDHMGEYIAWGHEAGEEGYDFDGYELARKKMQREAADVAEGKVDLTRWLKPSGEKAIAMIEAMITGRRVYFPSAIVCNDHAITNLPADVAVEIPVYVDAEGVHKLHVGELPPGPRALLSGQIGPQIMSVQAALHADRDMAMQALLCDPVVNSGVAAEKLLDELWEINKPYIRKCL